MKFSYRQLQKHFVSDLPAAEEIAEKLGLHSFELEGVEQLDNGDILIEWDILPNRSSDCLSYYGVAQEIAGLFELELQPLSGQYQTADFKTSDQCSLSVSDTELVPLASKRLFKNVQVGDSPQWLKDFLESQGSKSINNVVDLTNYVMFITGQPAHAFDAAKIDGNIEIRMAKEGEKVTDLTGEERSLTSSMLVIADEKKALDIAGVKGGADSGVSENTSEIILSACNFNAEQIRNTTRALKLHTDASKRFENNVPFVALERAHDLFADIMVNEFSAQAAQDIVMKGESSTEPNSVDLAVSDVNRLLGTSLSGDEIVSILSPFNFSIEATGLPERVTLTPPRDRTDLTIKQDWIEEIGRIYGYANIPEQELAEKFSSKPQNALKEAQYKAIDTLVAFGFYEVYNRSLVETGTVKLANALNAKAGYLREELSRNLRERAMRNLAYTDKPKLFEIGKVFVGISDDKVEERLRFAGIVAARKIKEKNKEPHFLETKGYLETVFEVLGVSNVTWQSSEDAETVATICINENPIGEIGVDWWELDFDLLVNGINGAVDYRKPSKYPRIDRDIAFFVPADVTVAHARGLIEEELPSEVIELELFDVFQTPGEEKKSFAFRLVMQSDTETLSDEFANAVIDKIAERLESEGYEIR